MHGQPSIKSNTRVRRAPSFPLERRKAQNSLQAHSGKSPGKEKNWGLPLHNDRAYNEYKKKSIARHYSPLIKKQKPFFIMQRAILLCLSLSASALASMMAVSYFCLKVSQYDEIDIK
jgi:hypothetical protein